MPTESLEYQGESQEYYVFERVGTFLRPWNYDIVLLTEMLGNGRILCDELFWLRPTSGNHF